jgi:hypothetical protein
VGGRGRKRREQLDAGGEHVVVVRNEPPNLDVVRVSVDLEMALTEWAMSDPNPQAAQASAPLSSHILVTRS